MSNAAKMTIEEKLVQRIKDDTLMAAKSVIARLGEATGTYTATTGTPSTALTPGTATIGSLL